MPCLIKAHYSPKTSGSWNNMCRPTRSPRVLHQTPKSLRLLCKQTSEELKHVNTRLIVLPVLVFCTSLCCLNFVMRREPEGNKYEWAVKIKTSADPQYDVDGTYTARAKKRLNHVYEIYDGSFRFDRSAHGLLFLNQATADIHTGLIYRHNVFTSPFSHNLLYRPSNPPSAGSPQTHHQLKGSEKREIYSKTA